MSSKSSIRVKTIDHVVLRTSKPDAMVKFYRELLNCNLERVVTDPPLFQLRAGDSLIDLIQQPDKSVSHEVAGSEQGGCNMDHLCLRIEAMDEAELRRILTQHDIEVPEFDDRYGAEGFGRSVYINDPEGNIVELKFAISPDSAENT